MPQVFFRKYTLWVLMTKENQPPQPGSLPRSLLRTQECLLQYNHDIYRHLVQSHAVIVPSTIQCKIMTLVPSQVQKGLRAKKKPRLESGTIYLGAVGTSQLLGREG